MNEVDICVFMEPVGKGRPRFSKIGGFIRTYTPAKTRKAEERIREAAIEALNGRKPFEQGVPIRTSIEAVYEPPKSWSKKKRHDAEFFERPKVSKCDCDNIEKLVLDALNGVVFYDDAQIVQTRVYKHYGVKNHLWIKISEVSC